MSRSPALSGTVLTLLLATLVASPARAVPGISLAWNHCLADGGIQNKVFACDTNSGEHKLVGTFRLGSDLAQVTGAEIVLQLVTASANLPAWWMLQSAGGCRNALVVDGGADPADVSCPDWSGGLMFVGLGTYCTSTGPCADHPTAPNKARIKIVEAVPQQAAASLVADQDYFSFNLRLLNVKTVGTDACSGCLVPACIVLNSIQLTTVGNLENRTITNEASPGGEFVTWQGGTATNCPWATPARNSTWGAVKSLYR